MASKFGRPAPKSAFKPGQSGNPGGRPKGHRDVEALARQCTPEAIAALRAALKLPRERVAAAQVLLDRGWGRPKQHMEVDGEGTPLLRIRFVDAVDATTVTVQTPTAASESGEEDTLQLSFEKRG